MGEYHTPPRLISTQRSPRTPALQRKWEVWDLPADKVANLSLRVCTAARFFWCFFFSLLLRAIATARTSNWIPPLLLFIRGALDKLPMKKKSCFFISREVYKVIHYRSECFSLSSRLCINSLSNILACEFIFIEAVSSAEVDIYWWDILPSCKSLSTRGEVVTATEAKWQNVWRLCARGGKVELKRRQPQLR